MQYSTTFVLCPVSTVESNRLQDRCGHTWYVTWYVIWGAAIQKNECQCRCVVLT